MELKDNDRSRPWRRPQVLKNDHCQKLSQGRFHALRKLHGCASSKAVDCTVETGRGVPTYIVTGSPPCVGADIIVIPAPLSVPATSWFQNIHWLRRKVRSEYIKVFHGGQNPNGSYRIHSLGD